MPTKKTKTPDQVRAELEKRGITIAEWSRRHEADYQTVRDLLLGRQKGRSGKAHRIAVLLGLKDGVIEQVA